MPIPAQRIIAPTHSIRNFGRFGDAVECPPLTDVQTRSYDRFLQLDVAWDKRTPTGLEGVMREIFPIESYDKKISLEYVKYELGKPRYDPDECRQLRLTYGRPFRVWLRLRKSDGTAVEEEVYLGDMPIMIGGGEFIINGAERAWSRSSTARRASTSSCPARPTRTCTRAGSSRSGGAGSRSTAPRRTRSASASTRAASSRRSRCCGRWTRSTARTSSLLREFYEVEEVKLSNEATRAKLVGDPDTNHADDRRGRRDRPGDGRGVPRRRQAVHPGDVDKDARRC